MRHSKGWKSTDSATCKTFQSRHRRRPTLSSQRGKLVNLRKGMEKHPKVHHSGFWKTTGFTAHLSFIIKNDQYWIDHAGFPATSHGEKPTTSPLDVCQDTAKISFNVVLILRTSATEWTNVALSEDRVFQHQVVKIIICPIKMITNRLVYPISGTPKSLRIKLSLHSRTP